jgi:hypothetical protein
MECVLRDRGAVIRPGTASAAGTMLLQEPHSWSSQHPPRSPTSSAPLHHRRPHFTFTCPSTAARVISRRRKNQKVVGWHLDLHPARARRLVPAGLYHTHYHLHGATQPPHTSPVPYKPALTRELHVIQRAGPSSSIALRQMRRA